MSEVDIPVTRYHFENLSKSDVTWHCPCCTVVSQSKQINTLKSTIESLRAELAKTHEYFADKMVQLLKQQKDCCARLEISAQQPTSASSGNKGSSSGMDKRDKGRNLTEITLAPMQPLALLEGHLPFF